MGRTLTRGQLAVVGLLLLVAAWLIGWSLASSAGGQRWASVLEATAPDLKQGLSPVVALVGKAAKPGLILAGLAMGLACLRRSWRSAIVFGAVVVLVNATVQVVKHPLVLPTPELGGLNPLSGHVGLVGGVGFAWLVAGPRRHRNLSVGATLLAVVGVSVGVIVAGWHTPAQVLSCLMIGVGWALIGAAALNGQSPAPPLGARRVGGGLALVGLVSAVAGLWVFAGWSAGSPHLLPEAALLEVVVGGGMGAAAVGVVLALATGEADPPRGPGRSPRAITQVGAVGSRT